MAVISMDIDPTIPSMEPPQPLLLQEEDGPSNSPEFLPPPAVFTGTPLSQPTPPGFVCTPEGYLTMQMLTKDTLASGAGNPPSPKYFPPGKKLLKKALLHENSDLSVFNVLNIFCCCWFLSVQKAEDGKVFWVKFTLQFHVHLVKSAVALVP
jgi:hypothetical protein